MKISRLIFLVLLTGCYSKRNLAGNNPEVSGSTCVDGLVVNIDAAGCKSLYFGIISEDKILKVACKHSVSENLWTRAEYYAIPFEHTLINPTWHLLCEDDYVKVYRACCK